MQTTMHQAIWN